MSDGGNLLPRITKAEHIGPNDTGDNIDAKRAANYIWNPDTSQWERWTGATTSSNLRVSGDNVSEVNPVPVEVVAASSDFIISTNNSSTTTLLANATFTGAADNVTNYGSAYITVRASHNAASFGLVFQISQDGTNWDDFPDLYNYTASAGGRQYTIPLATTYFRVKFTNGGTNQTYFRLQTKFTRGTTQSSHRIGDTITGENDAALVKAVLTGQDVLSGLFVDLQTYNNGSFVQLPVLVADGAGNSATVLTTQADNVVATTDATAVAAFNYVYDGTNFDLQRGDATAGAWVNIKGGISPVGTSLNTYSVHLTTNTTTTPTSSTAYISSIAISVGVIGTTSTVTIQDKQGTPLKLINGLQTVALTTTPTIVNFQTPARMVSGIDIITAGVAAATIDVWINYYQ